MKILVANSSKQSVGGGWSFISNLKKAIPEYITENYDEADVYFIAGATMIQRDEFEKAKKDGKKIVLRVDNVVRNSRNRNTGMSRMRDFARGADRVIYQSTWAQRLLGNYLGDEGLVILNGCDTSIFNTQGREETGTGRYLYSRYNRDETKNWEMARHIFQQVYAENKEVNLKIVGQFSSELVDGNFDFFMGEPYSFIGPVSMHSMAKIYKTTDYLIYTYFNDACSNTLIEALCSGCEIVDDYDMLSTGGSAEIMHQYEKHGYDKYFTLDRMGKEYMEVFSGLTL